jgi:hypothetical protein
MQFMGIDAPAAAVVDIAGQGVELIDLEQPAPDAAPQLRF